MTDRDTVTRNAMSVVDPFCSLSFLKRAVRDQLPLPDVHHLAKIPLRQLPQRQYLERAMPARSANEHGGAFKPAELALFDRVLGKLEEPDVSEAGRRALASRIIASYMAGITDEDELLSVARQPLGR
jgi:hypothetical protein